MGVSITSKYKGAPEINGSYVHFDFARIEIAKAINTDFGNAYEKWLLQCFDDKDVKKIYYHEMKKADPKNLANEEVCKFLFADDYNASISSKVCKAILPYVEKCNHSLNIGYSEYSTPKQDWNTLIELLKGCIRHHANLYWLQNRKKKENEKIN